MANNFFGNQPLDQPGVIGPGLKRRESDWQGAAKHVALPPEHPVRAAKGDLGMVGVPAPRASFEGGGATLTKPGKSLTKHKKGR
jgi:hypothetical protein